MAYDPRTGQYYTGNFSASQSGSAIPGPVPGGTPTPERRFAMPSSMDEFLELMGKIKDKPMEYANQPGGLFRNQEGAFRGAAGGKSSAALSALGTLTEDPVAALISAPVGIGAGAIANQLVTAGTAKMLEAAAPRPLKAAGMALRYLAPAMIGSSVQQATAKGVQNLTGSARNMPEAIQGASGGLFGLGSSLQDLTIPVPFLGNIAIGERAKRSREAEYQRGERRKDVQLEQELMREQSALSLQNDIAGARAIADINNKAYLTQIQAMQPILADAQRRELAGQQALLNTQGAIYQKLGRMSGMFQLADRGMAESGALARTMAGNSPYQAATLQAPQISFGR